MPNQERLLRDSFWDTRISFDEILAIAASDDFSRKQWLFERIMLHSTQLTADLSLFSKQDISELLNSIKTPSFNKDHFLKRKNLVEVLFLDQPLTIKELQWQI